MTLEVLKRLTDTLLAQGAAPARPQGENVG